MNLESILHYIYQNWFQLAVDIIAIFNVIIAGARAMGWSRLSDECIKVENAIQAMVAAALNRNASSTTSKTEIKP
jgi:hypothetical protein